MANIRWAPNYSSFVSGDSTAELRDGAFYDRVYNPDSGGFQEQNVGDTSAQHLKDLGQWNLTDPNSDTWKFLANHGDIHTSAGLRQALQYVDAIGSGFGGDRYANYDQSVRESLAGLNPQFVDQFAKSAAQADQQYRDSRPGDGFSIGGTLRDIGESASGLAGDMIPFALASLAAYGGVNALGGGFGAGAASGGATAGGAATGAEAGFESFLGPATGTVESAPVIGAAGAPTVSGVASGAGPFVPVVGGMTGPSSALSKFLGPSASSGGTASGAGTAAAAGGSSALARILRGEGVLEDYLSLGGAAAPGIIGALASNKQADSLEALNREFMAVGAPSRGRFESSFAPGFSMASDPGYKDALDQTTKSFLHKASISGNPADSPNAWQQTLKDVNSTFAFPALQEYRRLNAGSGGLAALTSAAPATAIGAINADANVFNSLGGAAADVFNPPRGLEDLLREFRRAA